MMQSLKLFGPNDIRLIKTKIPTINDNELLIKTDVAAVCGTDIRMWKNGYKNVDEDHPLILGHEFSGTIVEVGKNVPFYKEGMQVGIQPNIGCGICDRCVSGNSHLCDHYRAFGINMDGAFAEYVKIPEEAIYHGNLMVLPNGVTPEQAAITEPVSCAYNGFNKCFVKPGEYALVVGAGAIGCSHAMLLHMAGATVLMNDLSRERLEECKSFMPFIETYHGDDLAGFTENWTYGRGLDIAIVACPAPQVQAAMLPLMNYGGRVNFFAGIPAHLQPVALDTNIVHYKELYLTGSTRSSIAHFRKVLQFVSQKLINVDNIITNRYGINDILTAFENASHAKGIKHIICF